MPIRHVNRHAQWCFEAKWGTLRQDTSKCLYYPRKSTLTGTGSTGTILNYSLQPRYLTILAQYFNGAQRPLREDSSIDLTGDRTAVLSIREAAEKAKIELSSTTT
ncbi:hypothetical protein BD779DRAFT_1759973 [Infundibulicybe gibba]|nr:hypothetical protein BD779DRAFT_1759973 [Infundibulicybe gibba]